MMMMVHNSSNLSIARTALEGADAVCSVSKTSVRLASKAVSGLGDKNSKHGLGGDHPAACDHPDTGLESNAACASQAAAAPCQTPASAMHEAPPDTITTPGSTQSSPQAGAAGAPGTAGSSGQEDATSDAADNPILLGTSLFFARVPPTVSYESIMELFAQFGTVLTLNLFRPWATAKTSKGCGIIVYEHITAALAAMEALHNKYHWTGGETTMVLEWADPSRHRRENPNTKGVFEAKHKSQAMSNQKGHFRYRSQMRRAVALSLQQAATAGTQQHPLHGILPTSSGTAGVSRVAPMAIRGVSAMLPQLPGGMPGASMGACGLSMQDLHNAAAQQAALMTALATAAPLSNGAAATAALNNAACSAAAGCLVLPGVAQGLGAHTTSLAAAGALPGAAAPFGGTFPSGSWGAHVGAINTASLAAVAACGTEPGSPAFAAAAAAAAAGAGAGNLPALGSVLTPAMLQQGPVPSRFGPAGLAAGPFDCSSSGTPTSVQPQLAPNNLLQQAPVSYLAARVGLMADARMLAAAAAAIAHSTGSPVLGSELQDCHTPLAGSSQSCAFLMDSCSSTSHMGSAAHLMPQQQQWINLQKRHFAGSTGSLPALVAGGSVHGGAEFYSTGANVVGFPGELTLSSTPTAAAAWCGGNGAGGTPTAAAAWCGGNGAGAAKANGWW